MICSGELEPATGSVKLCEAGSNQPKKVRPETAKNGTADFWRRREPLHRCILRIGMGASSF